jgi:four helix bundle protein
MSRFPARQLQYVPLAMSMPESFQSRSFRLSLEVLRFYRALLETTAVPRHLANQMLRAGTSIGANLEEAKSAYSRRDLAAKYAISLREGRECHYWLRLIKADQPQFREAIDPLLDECNQLIAILTTTVRKLRAAAIATAVTSVLLLRTSGFLLLT